MDDHPENLVALEAILDDVEPIDVVIVGDVEQTVLPVEHHLLHAKPEVRIRVPRGRSRERDQEQKRAQESAGGSELHRWLMVGKIRRSVHAKKG